MKATKTQYKRKDSQKYHLTCRKVATFSNATPAKLSNDFWCKTTKIAEKISHTKSQLSVPSFETFSNEKSNLPCESSNKIPGLMDRKFLSEFTEEVEELSSQMQPPPMIYYLTLFCAGLF